MDHEHYWVEPKQPQENLAAECACGESLHRETDDGHQHFWDKSDSTSHATVGVCACGEKLMRN